MHKSTLIWQKVDSTIRAWRPTLVGRAGQPSAQNIKGGGGGGGLRQVLINFKGDCLTRMPYFPSRSTIKYTFVTQNVHFWTLKWNAATKFKPNLHSLWCTKSASFKLKIYISGLSGKMLQKVQVFNSKSTLFGVSGRIPPYTLSLMLKKIDFFLQNFNFGPF